MNFSDDRISIFSERNREGNKLCFESLNPSPCGHFTYLIYDEQRESVDTLIHFFCCGYLFNPSVLRTRCKTPGWCEWLPCNAAGQAEGARIKRKGVGRTLLSAVIP